MKDKILIVDDDLVLCKILNDILKEAGYDAEYVTNGTQAIEKIEIANINLVLLDLVLPGLDGIEIFRKLLKIAPDVQVIVMSGHGTIAKAVEVTKLGAYDFIEKPLEKQRVLLTVRNALEKLRLLRGRSLLLDEIKKRYHMVAVSPAMQRIFSLIDRIAPSDTTVLIMGESGSGKELVAEAIHLNSHRAEKPFVAVNCAAIPEELVESELFGHVKGSFTGALRDKYGKFQHADKGTIFFDEVAELSSRSQAKVLRAIEAGEVARVGNQQSEKVDVRFIAATNQDLLHLVEEKKFREDLYHRLNVIALTISPLRERPEDILPLIDHFMAVYSQTHHVPPKKLLPDAEGILLAYPWTGNVRELQHFVNKLLLLVDDESVSGVQISHLLDMSPLNTDSMDSKTLHQARDTFERNYILSTLQSNRWNVARTAEQLGIARTHLYRKFQKLNIQIPESVAEK